MGRSFLGKIFGPRKSDRDNLSLAGISVAPGHVQPAKAPAVPTAQQVTEKDSRQNSLFAFVDLKDPFVVSELAGEELPGPILSILSAKNFAYLFLFSTPHTQQNTNALLEEVSKRYPACQIVVHELPVSDPKDYSSLMGRLARLIRDMNGYSPAYTNNYVCVSSGTAEMRAAWFLLNALSVLPSTMLQVGSPAHPLFGPANVQEVRFDSNAWSNLRQLAMPWQYYTGYAKPTLPSASRRSGTGKELFALGSSETSGHKDKVEEAAPLDELSLGDELSKSSERTEQLSRITTYPSSSPIPGLDDALQELGIHVGSALLRYAAEQAAIAAESHLPVLLLGETGTGKERFAHLIHRMSPRSKSQIVAVNCAAIPGTLAESYLFGHTKGAFSGATSDKKGMFESADGTTLFLDEIAELPLEIQAKLLRVIQDGMVQKLGGAASRKIDVRVIAATNRDLANEVSAGRFREDLFFRLEVVQIKLPALCDRRGEIPELALALLKQINQRRHKPRQLSKAALLRLEQYAWPGNVRQLSNVLERSVLYARSEILEAEDLLITEARLQQDVFAHLPEPSPQFSIEEYLSKVRKQLFLRALAATGNKQAEAAALLGVSKQAVSKFVLGQNDNSD